MEVTIQSTTGQECRKVSTTRDCDMFLNQCVEKLLFCDKLKRQKNIRCVSCRLHFIPTGHHEK